MTAVIEFEGPHPKRKVIANDSAVGSKFEHL